MTTNKRIQRSRLERALEKFNGLYEKLMKAEREIVNICHMEARERGFDSDWDFASRFTNVDHNGNVMADPVTYCDALAAIRYQVMALCATHDELQLDLDDVEFGK